MVKKNRDYWLDRHVDYIKTLDADNDKILGQMNSDMTELFLETSKDMRAYIDKYGADNIVKYSDMMKSLDKEDRDLLIKNVDKFVDKYPQHADIVPVRKSIYKFNRMQGLQQSAMLRIKEFNAEQEKLLDGYLTGLFKGDYERVIKDAGLDSHFFKISDEFARVTANRKWLNNESFSERIWRNNARINQYIYDDLIRQVMIGENINTMIDSLRERFDSTEYQAKRLLWTESHFVINQAHKTAYTDIGVEEYELSAVLDSKTSKICQDIDGLIFKFEDMEVGENFPPFHPNCRTLFIGHNAEKIIDDLVGEEKELTGKDEIIKDISNITAGQYEHMTPDARKRIREEEQKYLNKMSENELLVYREMSRTATQRNNYTHTNNTAYYNPSLREQRVHMDLTSNQLEKLLDESEFAFMTKFHEEFHQLDDMMKYVKGYEVPITSLNRTASKNAIGREIANATNEAIKADVLDMFNRGIEHYKEKHGEKLNSMKSLNRIPSKAKKALHEFLQDEYGKEMADKAVIADITDTIGAATGGRWSPHALGYWGHSANYYKQFGEEAANVESWAHFGTYKMAKNKDNNMAMDELLPKTIAQHEKTFAEIIALVKAGEKLNYDNQKKFKR